MKTESILLEHRGVVAFNLLSGKSDLPTTLSSDTCPLYALAVNGRAQREVVISFGGPDGSSTRTSDFFGISNDGKFTVAIKGGWAMPGIFPFASTSVKPRIVTKCQAWRFAKHP